MSKISTVVLVALTALPSVALAGPYLGLGIWGARLDSKLGELSNGQASLLPNAGDDAESINADFSSTDVGYQIVAGWRFGAHFGVEAGWVDLGNARQLYELPELCNLQGCQSREWTAEVDTTGWQAFVTGYLPLSENVELYGKAGVIGWDTDFKGLERSAVLVPPPGPIGDPQNEPVAFSDDGTDLAVALGLNLKTDSAISVRTELSWYDVDFADRAWLLSLTAVYNF